MEFIYHVNYADGSEWVTCNRCGSDETHAAVDLDRWVCANCGHEGDTQDCSRHGDCDDCRR